MSIKKIFLTSVSLITILGATVATSYANDQKTVPATTVQHATSHHQCHFKHGINNTDYQAMHAIKKDFWITMQPLIKTKMALRIQLAGKIATPGTEMTDITPLLTKINENNAKITALVAKTQLVAFQKTGRMLFSPQMSGHHFNGFHARYHAC